MPERSFAQELSPHKERQVVQDLGPISWALLGVPKASRQAMIRVGMASRLGARFA